MEAVPRLPMISFELKTSPEAAQFGPTLKQYIASFYNEDPESYNTEINNLEALRAAAVRPTGDVAGCQTLKKYYCQLHFLKSRFPMQEMQAAAVYFSWKDSYSNMPCSVPDIRFELMCVLYNIGALHTQLGALDGRTSPDGLKMSCTHFQCAAWAFQTIKETYHQMIPYVSSVEVIHFMQQVCFAQAQECILEKSMMDNRKATITAKVAVQVVDHYKRASMLVTAGDDDSSFNNFIGGKTAKEWIKYLNFKISYYKAIALLFQGQQAEEQQKMGERVAFYQAACDQLEESRKLAGLKQQKDFSEAIAFTSDVIEGKRKAAKNENEFIYHEEVPDRHALQEVKGASLVKGIAFNVNDIEVSGPDIFARLVPMEAHEASSLYSEKKAQKLRQLGELVEAKDQALAEFMSSLQLDVFNQMRQATGLSQDLVDRAAALSAKPSAAQDLINAMGKLSNSYHEVESMLNEIQDLMKEEEKNEKDYQELMGKRPPSIISTDLSREAAKYREAHNKANDSNQNLHKAMMTHVANLKILAQPLMELQKQIPSVDLPNPNVDETCVKEIENLISKVEEMRNQRAMLWTQFREAVHKDDITSVLVTRQADQPLDQVFQKELQKHQELASLIEQNVAAQENILKAFVDAYARSMSTRRYLQDVISKRNATVTALITSYDTYEDLMAKANKGIDFYSKLETNVSKLLQRVKSTSKVQQEEREQMLLKNSVPVTKEEVVSSAPKLKDYLDTRKRPIRGEYQDVTPQYYPPDAPSWPPAVRPAPLGSEVNNDSVATKPNLDQTLAERMANLRTGQYSYSGGFNYPQSVSPNTNTNKQAFTVTTDTYQPISSATQNNQYPVSVGGFVNPQQSGYSMGFSGQSYGQSDYQVGQSGGVYGQNGANYDQSNYQSGQSTNQPTNYGQNAQYISGYGQGAQPVAQYGQVSGTFSHTQLPTSYEQPSQPNYNQMNQQNQTPYDQIAQSPQPNYNQVSQSNQPTYGQVSQQNQPNYGQVSGYTQVSQPNQTSYTQVSQPNQPNYGQVSQSNQPSYSQVSQSNQPGYNQVSQPNQSNYTQVSQPSQPNYGQVSQSNQPGYNQVSQSNQPGYSQVSQPNQSNYTQVSQPSQPNYGQVSQSNQLGYTQVSQPNQPNYGQVSVSNQPSYSPSVQSDQPSYNQIAQPSQPAYNQTNYPQVSQSNYSQPAGYQYNQTNQPTGYEQVGDNQSNAYYQPKQENYSYSSTINEYATSVRPNIINPVNSTYSSPTVDIKSSSSNSGGTNYVMSNGQSYPSYDVSSQYQYYYNYPGYANYANAAYNYPSQPTPEPAPAPAPPVTTKESNIDLLTGLDFSVNQAPLIPQQKTTEVVPEVPAKVVTSKEEVPVPVVVPLEKVINRKPFNNAEVKKLFALEIDKFDKFVDVLTQKTLSGPTNLDLKWKEIQDKQELEKKAISVARCYPMKNRYPDILPYDYSRVELTGAKDDYINASYVKDISYYAAPFIVAQAPLSSTIADFWTMIKEQNIELVVSLLNDSEIGPDIYWPLEKGRDLALSGLVVSLISLTVKPHWIERLISIGIPEKRDSRVLIHLQFTSWPGSLFPTNPEPISTFVTEIANLYLQQRSTSHPVVVHCSSGIGRSGLVCLLVSAILEVTSNSSVMPDLVNLSVKLGAWRRNMLRDREHLKFAYEAFLTYMKQVLAQGHAKRILNEVDVVKEETSVETKPKQEIIDDPLNSLDPFWASKKGTD